MRRRAPFIAGAVGVVALALVVVLLVAPSGGGDEPEASPLVGGVAPGLTGTTLDGGTFDIDDHRGRWVLVNYFATWCPPCVEEHPELVEFSERRDGEVQVVSVAFDETPSELAEVERFFAAQGGDWPVVVGGGGGASLDWGVKKLPESFLVDPAGTVVAKINGGVTADELDAQLVDLAGGRAQVAEHGDGS